MTHNVSSVLALGRKLVDELGLEPSVDTLGRWMAHYIAGLIDKAENSADVERASAEKECSEMILKLWNHRSELPNGKRPFEELEPIIRAIGSLNLNDASPRYFHSQIRLPRNSEETSPAAPWLALMEDIDNSAKLLIRYCIAKAAHTAAIETSEWVALAKEAGVEIGVPEIVSQFVSSTDDIGNNDGPEKWLSWLLEEGVERLKRSTALAGTVLGELEIRLQALDSTEDDETL